MEYLTLQNGNKMPIIGLGTYLLSPKEAEAAVISALKNGYRLIDTANAYVNEKGVGRGIKKSGVKREEIFLETKLWPSFYNDKTAIDKTLERLDTPYIDLMILHQPAGDFISGYRLLEEAYKKGQLKAIGISNFNEEEIKKLLDVCEIKPMLIQSETHPYYQRKEFNEFLKKNDIILQSWYPLGGKGNASIMNDPLFIRLAEKYHKSSAQVILRWHTQMGYNVIPGSKNEEHIKQNIDIFDFTLTPEELKEIESLDKENPIYVRTEESLKMFAAWRPDVEGQE